MKVFVVFSYYDWDGYSEPSKVFLSEERARNYIRNEAAEMLERANEAGFILRFFWETEDRSDWSNSYVITHPLIYKCLKVEDIDET